MHEAEGLCPPPSAVWELRDSVMGVEGRRLFEGS